MLSWLNVAGFFRVLLLLKELVLQIRHVSLIVIIINIIITNRYYCGDMSYLRLRDQLTVKEKKLINLSFQLKIAHHVVLGYGWSCQ